MGGDSSDDTPERLQKTSRRQEAQVEEVPRPAAATDAAMEMLFSEEVEFKVRFGDLTGAPLLDRIFSAYQVGGLITIPWYSSTGERNIIRHPVNQRRQDCVVRCYAESIKRRGIVCGVRSEPWMVYSPGRVFPALAVSFGSLSESYYYSRQTAPNNMFVVAALHKGLTGVRMFHEKTPTNVLAFLKAYNNEFHGGSSLTFLEMLEEALQFEMEWTSHRTSKGISSKAPNYVTCIGTS